MAKIKDLEKRLEQLEHMLLEQQKMISTLLSQLANKEDKGTSIQNTPSFPQVPVNGVCPGGCIYPSPWMSTVPPHCKKCGVQAPDYTTIICTTLTDGLQPLPKLHRHTIIQKDDFPQY